MVFQSVKLNLRASILLAIFVSLAGMMIGCYAGFLITVTFTPILIATQPVHFLATMSLPALGIISGKGSGIFAGLIWATAMHLYLQHRSYDSTSRHIICGSLFGLLSAIINSLALAIILSAATNNIRILLAFTLALMLTIIPWIVIGLIAGLILSLPARNTVLLRQ